MNESKDNRGIDNDSTVLLKPYKRRAKYYETDKMSVIHHSNYIRWFEEARVDFLDQIGMGFDKIEAAGVYSPVLTVNCTYKSPVRFNEEVYIIPKLAFFNGIKMTVEYIVIDVNSGKIRVTGNTSHCFINTDFKPVSLKKEYKYIYDTLYGYINVNFEV